MSGFILGGGEMDTERIELSARKGERLKMLNWIPEVVNTISWRHFPVLPLSCSAQERLYCSF
jgi:hypothetical protein